jgi:Fe-S cluster assembly protein SufB
MRATSTASLLDWRLKAFRALADDERAALGARALPADRLPGHLVLLRARKSKPTARRAWTRSTPKLLATYEKLGVPLHERARLAGVAVDAVFDSVSVATTFKASWPRPA